MKYSKNGFTLIEVLVASVILFSVIATITMIYKGSYLSSEKSEANVAISGVIPVALNQIQEVIRANGDNDSDELTSNGKIWLVTYQWSADLISFKSAQSVFDPDSGERVAAPTKYKLWKVNLSLKYKSSEQLYTYSELSWNEK